MKNWNNFEINLSNSTLISKELLRININKFWEDIINKLNDNQHVLFILRIKFDNNQMKTVTTLKKIDKTMKKDLIEYLYTKISLSNETYSTLPIISIIFNYGIREGKIDQSTNELSTNIYTKYQTYYKNKLPIVKTGSPSEYGRILRSKNDQYFIIVDKKTTIILDLIYTYKQQVNKIIYIKNGQTIFNWTDTIIGENKIVREIGKSIYHYENMELVLVKVIKKSKPIDKN